MDISSVDELLTTTRSVRKRLDLTRPVERDVILECVRLAMQAQTASNAQDWHWLVNTDAAKRAAIAEAYQGPSSCNPLLGLLFRRSRPAGRGVCVGVDHLLEHVGR